MQNVLTTTPETTTPPLKAGDTVTVGGFNEYTVVRFIEWDLATIERGTKHFAPVYEVTNGFDGIETMAFHAI
jgi:hypothetical protein